jgi:DHA2 family lincomycin resistance protein-like MFS transporter
MTGIYAGVTASREAAGTDPTRAASTGFLVAGLVTAAFAIGGIALTLWLRRLAAQKAARAASPESQLARIMKTDVYSLSPSQRVGEALGLLVDKRISGAPIVDKDGKPIGFVSDGDVMRYLADQHPAFTNAWSFVVENGNADFDETLSHVMELPVTEIATDRVIALDVDTEFGEVCRILTEHHLRKAPVTRDGRMVGIVNRSNISRYAVKAYAQSHAL